MPATEIEAAKSTLIGNNALVGWCTRAVVVGLLVEYLILFATKRKEFSKAEFGLAIAAAFLIAGGVYGEYFFGSRASEAALILERKSEESVATLQKSNKQLGIDLTNAKADLATKQSDLNTKLEQERRETARAQKEADTARLALAKELKHVGDEQLSRYVNPACVKNLTGEPKGKVDLLYAPEDINAFILAEELYDCLGVGTNDKPGAGWEVSKPHPIPDRFTLDPRMANAPSVLRVGASWGVSIISRDLAPKLHSAFWALSSAVSVGVTPNGGLSGMTLPSLPDDQFIVVVGPKAPAIPWSSIQALEAAIKKKAVAKAKR